MGVLVLLSANRADLTHAPSGHSIEFRQMKSAAVIGREPYAALGSNKTMLYDTAESVKTPHNRR